MSKLPRKLHLPSGRIVVGLSAERTRGAEVQTSLPMLLAAYEHLERRPLRDAETGTVVEVARLALSDFHVLGACLARLGAIPGPSSTVACRNCGESISIDLGSFEWGPYEHGELTDPELDRPFDFDAAHPIPKVRLLSGRPASRRRSMARSVSFAPRTAGDVLSLLRHGDAVLGRATIAALGIARLGGEARAGVIAEALSAAPDEVWGAIGTHWEDAHVPPRLVMSGRCGCGAKTTVPILEGHAFDLVAPRLAVPPDASEELLSPESFGVLVEQARVEVYSSEGIRELPVVIDEGPPACDAGGEPLLGSYLPPDRDGLLGDQWGEIRLYYRSFLAELELDPTFDVSAEVRETVRHEVEHHLHFLSGYDPMDEEERAEIVREQARFVGRTELGRRAIGTALGEVKDFFVRALPLVLLLVVLSFWQFCRH